MQKYLKNSPEFAYWALKNIYDLREYSEILILLILILVIIITF